MNSPEPSVRTIAIDFPTTGLTQIDLCAQRSGLPAAKFYSVALALGARIQVISLEPVASLPPSLRKEAARSANTSITPESLVRLVSLEKSGPHVAPPAGPDGQVAVAIGAEAAAQLDGVAQTSGIEPSKLYALALATGVQMLASSLTPEGSVPLEILVQMSEGALSPESLSKSLMDRQEHLRSKKPSPGVE